jgi:signal transduction histidine kinase
MTAWWTNLALRSKGLIVIAIPCVILLGVIVAVYAVDVAESRADAVVAHGSQVRTSIERALALMDRAETSVRSYLIVPRREFLDDYARARQQILDTFEQLGTLLERDEVQSARLRSVDALVVDRLKALDVVGRMPDPDGRFRERSVRTGQAVLESLRATLGLMQEDAEAVLAAQTAAAERQAAMMGWLLLLSGATGIGGGIVAAILFTSGLGDRMRRLGDAARDIRQGTYDTRLPDADDEVGLLAAQLREAAVHLAARERQLRRAHDDAAAANRAKRDFLLRLSQELRARLNASGVESADQLVAAGHHLLRLVNDVLDAARIEAGTLNLSRGPVPVAAVVQDAVAQVAPLAAAQRVAVSVRDDDFKGVHVRADRQALVQVVANLLSHAVRYSRPDGRVDVTSALGATTFRLAVHDMGLGIARADLDRVFEPFEPSGAESAAIPATGLELHIARGLVAAMEGRLTAESQPGQGSVLTLELALERPESAVTSMERAS